MSQKDFTQDITIEFLKEQFKEIKEISKDHASKEDIARQQGLIDNHCQRLRVQETLSAASKEILKNINEQIEKLSQKLDRVIEVNQADIGANRKRIESLEVRQATSWVKLSIVWVAITMIGVAILNYIIDMARKHISG